MPNDKDFRVDGFVPEPDSPKHWGFEDSLQSRLVSKDTGDVDLRPFSSPRHNQRRAGSCVAQSVVKALEIKRIIEQGRDAHVDLSVAMVYYLSRELQFPPMTHKDSGTFISHACDALRRFGVAPEVLFPYDAGNVTTPPTFEAMREGFVHKIDSFHKIRSTGDKRVAAVIEVLRSHNPVVFGTTVGSNWFNYKKGQVLKKPSSVEGRHATCLVGYKDGNFIGENSWGTGFGDDGFYLMDPSVIASSQSADFWIVVAPWQPYTVASSTEEE